MVVLGVASDDGYFGKTALHMECSESLDKPLPFFGAWHYVPRPGGVGAAAVLLMLVGVDQTAANVVWGRYF
jgi:hypothetical protein